MKAHMAFAAIIKNKHVTITCFIIHPSQKPEIIAALWLGLTFLRMHKKRFATYLHCAGKLSITAWFPKGNDA